MVKFEMLQIIHVGVITWWFKYECKCAVWFASK